ncbi:hypothetical protein VTK56DRAFT_7485 [Thermocarpiscus australiensis]
MATGAQPRAGVNLDVPDSHSRSNLTDNGNNFLVLGEIPLNKVQTIRPATESSTPELDKLHLVSTTKENISRQRATKSQGHKPPLATQARVSKVASKAPETRLTFHASSGVSASVNSPRSQGFQKTNSLALASRQLPSNQEQLSKHQEGQFEWLLSIPLNESAKARKSLGVHHDDAGLRQGEKKLYFGCNLVHRRTQSGGPPGSRDGRSANIYTLLATRIEGEAFTMDDSVGVQKTEATVAEPQTGAANVPETSTPLDAKPDAATEHLVVSQPSRPLSRIEDSVEALDKLEEDLEALDEVARLKRVESPETENAPTQSSNEQHPKQTATVKAGANPGRAKSADRKSSVRESASATSAKGDEKTPLGNATGSGARKRVPRPASLQPPKAPARSSKPPTVPTFELPGEAVARRLKEQREARRSQHIAPEQAAAAAAAYSPSKPHVKSTKPPTRPTFELPGEAISRRKREEREAKLRAQEEEERKRREFKARPIRASLAPSTVPRETLASLARQNKAVSYQRQADATEPAAAAKKKRHSIAAVGSSASTSRAPSVHPASANTAATPTHPPRGRGPVADPASDRQAASRATSTSTGSIHGASNGGSGSGSSTVSSGKRSTVSAEEAAQQRLRGKEIFSRDNKGLREERELERRQREEAARLARQEAAERSRQLSRQWAEKQRAKKERRMEKKKGAGAGEGEKKKEGEVREEGGVVVAAAA